MKQLRVFNHIESWFPNEVQYFIDGLDDGEEFEVVISSPGGDAMAGITAYHQLKPYKPTVKILAHASSSASVLAMCGGKIIAEEGSLMLLHPASSLSFGTAKDHEKNSKNLQKITESAKSIYMTRFTGTEEELGDILEMDEFHDAKQLKEWGFIDEIVEAEKITDDETATAAMAWMAENITQPKDNYVNQYFLKLEQSKQNRPNAKTTNIIKQNEDSNMEIQEKFNEQVQMNADLNAELKAKQQEFEGITAKMDALQESVATMTSEKDSLEKKLQERTEKFDEVNAKLAEFEKANMQAEIDKFLEANSEKIAPAQKDVFAQMLASAKDISDEKYNETKKSIESMPKLSILDNGVDTTNREGEDDVVMTSEEAFKLNWSNIDLSVPENDAKFTMAINAVLRDNKDMTPQQAEDKLMEVK